MKKYEVDITIKGIKLLKKISTGRNTIIVPNGVSGTVKHLYQGSRSVRDSLN